MLHGGKEPLDNPVWSSLVQTHKSYAIDYGTVKFYHPDYCPFGSFDGGNDVNRALLNYSTLADNFFVVGEKPEIPAELKLKGELVCLQMIASERIASEPNDQIIKLNTEHSEAVLRLVNLVQPGYFKSKTFLLGDYFGIYNDRELVAVTGERMRMDDFVEVSAVITHPDHLRKGYASQLVAYTTNKIHEQGKTPFLHVANTNSPAIELYKKSGYSSRRIISFWNITRSLMLQ